MDFFLLDLILFLADRGRPIGLLAKSIQVKKTFVQFSPKTF